MGRCHEVDYRIIGGDLQAVEVELDPGETVIAEAGAMVWMEDGIEMEAKLGDGSESGFLGKVIGAAKRKLAGESTFVTHFTNKSDGKKHVAFAGPYPGRIIPVNLGKLGGVLYCQKDAFLCAAYGTKISIAFTKRFGVGIFGGEGFILEKLEGDGMVFLHAGGAVEGKELKGGSILVDTGCLVAFTEGIDYDISRVGGIKSMLFGGEGIFLASLSGTGNVWVQSMPFSRLADRILANAPAIGGESKGESSFFSFLGED